MCFSVQVDKDLKKLARQFNAKASPEGFKAFEALQSYEAAHSPEELKDVLGLKRKPSSRVFKEADDQGRIYPGSWAPVIVMEKGERLIKPMRYRVRPQGSTEEIPSKYNVFNCRVDSLDKRKTWQNIFMKNHALFPFVKFYEWVELEGKKTLIHFKPKDREVMWAPAIYDTWRSKDGKIAFDSFALITDEPPKEVEEMGHDRCPIFLKTKNIDPWLNPLEYNKTDVYQLLKQKEDVFYEAAK
jgi:putative SOS response-associated peptidase YedK